jgi:hypothetical protein
MPITPTDSSLTGFGLWKFPLVAVPFEPLHVGTGVWLYVRYTRPLNRQGSFGFWVLILFLLVAYAVSLEFMMTGILNFHLLQSSAFSTSSAMK